MENKVKQAGFWNTLTAFMGVAVAGVMVLSMTSGPASHAAEATSGAAAMVLIVQAFLLMGFLVALFSFFHMHLLGRETLEQMEYEELTSGASDSSMFEADAFPARRSREQFDKWFVPGFTGLLLIFQSFTTVHLFGTLTMQSKTDRGLDQATLVLALSAVFGLLFFLRGRYSTLMSRMGKEVILQPGSDFLLLGSYLLFFQAIASAGSLLEYERLHHYVGAGFVILMAVLALETLLRLILDIYRPRVEGREVRQLYHSRLVGLISKPESFFTTAGHALNYQFGFEVSETWGYRFVRDRFFMIFLLQIFVLWLSTSVVIIQPNEVGIVQRAGEPMKLNPGIRFKLPWPLESVDRFNPDKILTLEIGPPRAVRDPDNPNPPQFWDAPDVLGYVENISMREELYKEYFLTKPTPGLPTPSQEINATESSKKSDRAHMLFGHVTIKYRIADVNQWAQVSADPIMVLQQVAEREVTREFLQRDATALLTTERDEAARAILANIRDRVGQESQLNLGLDVISVGLAGLQPPSEPPTIHVMSAQDRDKTKETGSQSPAQAFTNFADILIVQDARYALQGRESESNATVARTKARGIIKQAQTEALAIGRKKKVDDDILAEFLKTYQKSAVVFPYFLYMEQFMRAVGRARRVWAISGSNPQDRIEFKFDKTSGGLPGMVQGVDTPGN